MTNHPWERLPAVVHGAAERGPEEREACLAAERLVGAHFGPYRVIEELGRGGMGRVYLARRDDDQFQRLVALKLADAAQSPDVEKRLRSERQILAALDHPNIARLLDGGATAEGVPYLVLEYVEGERIDRYCDLRQLDVEERLQLFRTVCSAVHYAHQNLVVHRDLKPSNVLVTGEGIPKLLDFGIAKLLKPELLARGPELTTVRHRPMTPDYASPEQVRGEAVTTASDVYSLGVMLYELLAGSRPLRLEGQGPAIERIVSEVDPEPPSRAVLRPDADGGDPAPGKRARDRRTTPERLRRRLEGDLDNIVMMALRKAPARRYASAEQMAEDVRRTSNGLPVRARRDTIRYRVRKFVGRHRYSVTSALVVLALVVGFGVSRARLARDLGVERDRARQEAESARNVASFLEDIYRFADPTGMRGGAVTAREILDRAAARLAQPDNERPGVRSDLLDTMGVVYRHLGLYDRAEPLLEEALALRRRTLGEESRETARSLLHLGQLRVDQSRYPEGEDLLRRSLRVEETLPGRAGSGMAEALYSLGYVLRQEGRTEEAEGALRRVVALREGSAGGEVALALALDRLASVLQDRGDLEEAGRLARRAVDITRRRLGHHPDTARCLERLGSLLTVKGQYAAAEPLLQEGLSIRRDYFGPDHPAVGAALDRLADLRRERGDFAGAEPLYRDALALSLATLGESHLQVAAIRAGLAEQRLFQGQTEEAEALFQSSLQTRLWLGPENTLVIESHEGLARVAAARGDLAAAETAFRQALDARRDAGVAHGLSASSSLLGLGEVLLARGQAVEAEPLLRQALDVRLGVLSDHHWRVAEARGALGACLLAQGRYGHAEPLLVESLTHLNGRPAAGRAAARLVRLYEAWGRPDRAQAYRGRAASL